MVQVCAALKKAPLALFHLWYSKFYVFRSAGDKESKGFTTATGSSPIVTVPHFRHSDFVSRFASGDLDKVQRAPDGVADSV